MAIIKLKKGFSGVTPTGLTLAEPAFDYKDNKLYVGVTASAVWVGGEVDNNTALGTSQIKIPTQFAVKTYIDNLGLSPGVVVTGINGVTGNVLLGVTGGPGLSIVNPTGSGKGITLVNTGVLSVNGNTGAIINIAATNTTNSFSSLQTFTSGINVAGGATVGTYLKVTGSLVDPGGYIELWDENNTYKFTIQPESTTGKNGTFQLGGADGFVVAANTDGATSGWIVTASGAGLSPTWINPNAVGFTAYGATISVNLQGGANGSLPYQTGANTTGLLGIGSANTILRSNGLIPTWVNPNASGFTAFHAQELVGGAAGNLVYQSGVGNSSFVTNAGSTGFFLTYNTTTNTPTWVNPNTVGFTAYGATISVNVQGGAAGSLPYNSAANTTTFLGIGAAGTILTSTGSAPQWSTATGLTVGTAQNISVTAETADTTTYVTFVGTNTNSNQALEYNSSLVYNAVNNFLEANIDGGLF